MFNLFNSVDLSVCAVFDIEGGPACEFLFVNERLHSPTSLHLSIVSILFVRHRLFEKCPQAKVLFGFPIDVDAHSEELITSKRFLMVRSLVARTDTYSFHSE